MSLCVLTTLLFGRSVTRVNAFLFVPLEHGATLIVNFVSPIVTILVFFTRTTQLGRISVAIIARISTISVIILRLVACWPVLAIFSERPLVSV